MKWIRRITGMDQRMQLDELVQRVAARSQNLVWQRVQLRVGQMSPHQVRGYVRARAALVVNREADIALARQTQPSAWLRETVVDRATEQVISLIAAQATRPALRRAA